MSHELLPVWKEIEWYLNQGISVIPCYDHNTVDKSLVKKPCVSWSKYQEQIIDREVLFDLMDVRFNTTAISIICGKVSGNLEAIDIDVKNWAGIDAQLFATIEMLYPQLWTRLRIHQTPSGGFHILYRIEDGVAGKNQKLCFKDGVVSAKGQPLAAVETRGEGGYIMAPPSVGYRVYKDNPIPLLTWAERCSLFAICEGFNQHIKPAPKQYSPTKADDKYYDQNPFDHFNGSAAAQSVLITYGWKYLKENAKFIYFERPDQTEHGRVAASFNKEKRVYYIFTSSTLLEPARGYNPATIISILQFGGGEGSNKETYRYLVEAGYGKIKPTIEARIIKSATTTGRALPANLSESGGALHVELSAASADLHPHGVFWVDSMTEGIQIDRERLYIVAEGLGFRVWHDELVMIEQGRLLSIIPARTFYDAVKAYIREGDADLYRDICNAYEAFIERHGKFTTGRLPILPDELILHDGRDVAYKFYQNCYLRITAYEVVEESYDQLADCYVWKNRVQGRNYRPGEGGKYVEFLHLATNMKDHGDYITSCIGYLAHDYRDETTAYIIVLSEQVENPEDGGGSGKNVFSNLFKHTTTITNKPGSQVKFDEKFLQSWNRERIFCISDIPKDFQIEFLKELSAGSGLLKKLFKDERTIETEDMCKFLLQTNFSITIKDGGVRRRVRMIEFTDFFTKCGGIDVHFGTHFPREWTADDWAGYDTFMANAVSKWLKSNLKLKMPNLTASGWIKQFEQTYGHIITEFILQNFTKWCELKLVYNDDFKILLDAYFRDNNTPVNYRPSMHRINKALREYCKKYETPLLTDVPKRDGLLVRKCRIFGDEEATPF